VHYASDATVAIDDIVTCASAGAIVMPVGGVSILILCPIRG